MAFVEVCNRNRIFEGEVAPYRVAGREILIVWPEGGEPRAFDGMCPHQGNVPLGRGYFNGRNLTCPAHEWIFDGRSGEGLRPTGCRLTRYALRLTASAVEVDLATPLS